MMSSHQDNSGTRIVAQQLVSDVLSHSVASQTIEFFRGECPRRGLSFWRRGGSLRPRRDMAEHENRCGQEDEGEEARQASDEFRLTTRSNAQDHDT